MKRTTQRALADPSAPTPRLKPVFAPDLTPLSDMAGLVFLDLQSESYDSAGVPRLELGAPGPDSNALTRIQIANSAANPSLRQVFIPEWPYNTSFLVEGADGRPGVMIVSFGVPSGAKTGVSVIFAPNTALADIAQGDHGGVLQIVAPKRDTVSTTIELHREPTGYFKYRTLTTSVTFADLSQGEIKDVTRRVDQVLADQLAAVLSQCAFDIEAPPEDGQTLVRFDVACTPGCRRVLLCVVQATGFFATLTGGILLICNADNPMAQAGAALSMAGGLFRAGTGFYTAATAPAPNPDPDPELPI